ncbi:hypothetical protein GCM10020331_102180 [Ectobacillus funiculus]
MLLFIVYYGLPQLLNGLGLNLNEIYKGIFVIITLSLLFAAAMAEVMRSAYESLDKGQYEAGVSIGLSGMQTFIRIILPQCFVIALPNLGNALIALFFMKEQLPSQLDLLILWAKPFRHWRKFGKMI